MATQMRKVNLLKNPLQKNKNKIKIKE